MITLKFANHLMISLVFDHNSIITSVFDYSVILLDRQLMIKRLLSI